MNHLEIYQICSQILSQFLFVGNLPLKNLPISFYILIHMDQPVCQLVRFFSFYIILFCFSKLDISFSQNEAKRIASISLNTSLHNMNLGLTINGLNLSQTSKLCKQTITILLLKCPKKPNKLTPFYHEDYLEKLISFEVPSRLHIFFIVNFAPKVNIKTCNETR